MTEKEAVELAMFALNTWIAPDASTDEDIEYMDKHADEAVAILHTLAERL